MNFKKRVKSIQTAGYNGVPTVYGIESEIGAGLGLLGSLDFMIFLSYL